MPESPENRTSWSSKELAKILGIRNVQEFKLAYHWIDVDGRLKRVEFVEAMIEEVVDRKDGD